MAKEQAESKLKLIHLVWMLGVAILSAGIAFGTMANQQKTNTARIQDKVEKDILEQHQKQQAVTDKRTYDYLVLLGKKIDDLKK